jgi:hypothetical protein
MVTDALISSPERSLAQRKEYTGAVWRVSSFGVSVRRRSRDESAEVARCGKDRRRILAQPQPYARNTSLNWEQLALD